MTQPVWTTAKGSLGSINEREAFSKKLEATLSGQLNMPNLQPGAGLKFTKVAGELPPGLELSPKGIIQGVPFEVATRKVYEFVVRVQDVGALPTIDIAERTFTIEVEGADAPIFATGAGQLDLSDSTSTITPTKWVIDGTEVNYQILATDTDTATGQTLVYDIVEGSLPTGLTMSPTGLISGVVRLAQDEKYGPRGGYAGDEDYDGQVWDRTVFTKSKSMNYEFKVRVTDGSSVTTQYNNIFVVTADWWRIDNTAITIDQTIYKGSPLTIDLSALRRPVFTTPSNLGAYRHDNQIVIRIDVEDFDPLQADLEYSIVSGSLPTGLSIDLTSGEIYGKLPVQAAVTKEHSFTIRAKRTVTSTTFVFTDKEFKLSVYGEIDVGVAFTTASDLGTVDAGIPSLKNLEATVAGANRVVRFTLTGGQLPPGLRLSPQGNIIGIPRINQYTVLDNNGITFDTNVTSFDREYTFTVEASDQYKALSTTRTFTLRIGLPYGFDYSSLQGHGTSTPDKNLFYSVAQDPNINNDDNIFRSEDKNFGVKERPEMLLVSGLKPSTLKTIQEQIELNHGPKTLYFGNLKTAVAKIDNKVVYEVVYIEMKDPMTNNSGQAVAKEVNLRSVIKKPLLGPAGDDDYITADADQYNVTTSDGLSFSISGSKVRYANELSADLGAISKLFPNAVANMRSRIKDLGEKEYVHLPLWMRSSQPGSGAPLGYQTAMVIAYCKPGRSELVKARIEQKQLDFKKINFTIDRYVIGNAGITSPASFVGDGTTKEFTMNQIINSEDVNISIDNAVVAQATVDSLSLFAGNSTFGVDIVPATGILKRAFEITADNSELPTYLSADTTIRSADLQNPYVLTHDLVNKKTTITFSKAPQNKSKISVDYKGDKYLVFRRKGI